MPLSMKTYLSGRLMATFIYPTPAREYQGILKYWHREGGLQYEAHFLSDPRNFHGLVTEYDQEGRVIEQERYQEGTLLEKIK